MSLPSSDGIFDSYFGEFTPEDLDKIDSAVTEAWNRDKADNGAIGESFQSDIGGPNIELLDEEEWDEIDNLTDIEELVNKDREGMAEASFRSEIDGLNLGTLTEDDFERLDSAVLQRMTSISAEPSVPVQFEGDTPNSNHNAPSKVAESGTAKKPKSPLRQFRPNGVISVSDLVAPTW